MKNEKKLEMETQKRKGVELIKFKKVPNKKVNRIRIRFPFFIMPVVCLYILLLFVVFPTTDNNKSTMSYNISLIENYYNEFDPIEFNNKNYEILHNLKEGDDNLYINAYYGENKSNGDIFIIENDHARLLTINNSYEKIREWASSEGLLLKNIKVNDRKKLDLYLTVEYKFGGRDLSIDLECYYPTGEITFIDNYGIKKI